MRILHLSDGSTEIVSDLQIIDDIRRIVDEHLGYEAMIYLNEALDVVEEDAEDYCRERLEGFIQEWKDRFANMMDHVIIIHKMAGGEVSATDLLEQTKAIQEKAQTLINELENYKL